MDKLLKYKKTYNQLEYVEYLLENPAMISDSQNYFSNLRLLTIYLKEIKGMKPKERERFVYDFVEKNDMYYKKAVDYSTIDKALKAGAKGQLKIVPSIILYKKEFDYIDNLDLDINRKKVIFSSYCFAKVRDKMYPQYAGSPYISKKVVTVAKIKSTSNVKDDIRYYFNELQKRYFDWTIHGDTSIILPSIEEMPKCTEEDEHCVITNFDKLYLYYDYFSGDKSISFCKICGAAFRDKNYKKAGARQQYCKDCSSKEKTDGLKRIKCENCGEVHWVSTKIKREKMLCDKCYQQYRREHNREKSSRLLTELTDEGRKIVCEQCGKQVIISKNAKRQVNLCDDCYKKYRSSKQNSYH